MRLFDASCAGGVVLAGTPPLPVVTAKILSEGVGPSTGVLFLDGDEAYYVALTTPDVKTAIEKLIDTLTQTKAALDQAVSALNQTATTFTATFAGMTGPTTAPPPTGPAGVAAIITAATSITAAGVQLEVTKTALTVLKGVMK